MLRTVDLAYEAGVAVLGVNVGPARLPHRGRARRVRRRARPPARRRLRGRRAHGARGHGRVGGLGAAAAGSRSTRRCSRRCTPAASSGSRSTINGTLLHDVRGRRRDRRHADRLHRVLVLGARPDRVAASPVPAAHAGVAAHAVRPVARARRRGDAAVRRVRRPQRGAHARRARARRARAPATRSSCTGGAAPGAHRHASGPATSTRS